MSNKNCLLIGCGSRFGLGVLNHLVKQGYTVYSISGSTLGNPAVKHLQVDWKTLTVAVLEKFLKDLPTLDLIFFNQNSSALSEKVFEPTLVTVKLWQLEKDWAQSYFLSCIMPFHIVHTLKESCGKNTKVIWMLSPLVYNHIPEQVGFADYISNKYQNYLILKNFSHKHSANFIGLNPDKLLSADDDAKIKYMIEFIETANKEANGRVFFLDGTEDTNFVKAFKN